jgi:hypothetical protein
MGLIYKILVVIPKLITAWLPRKIESTSPIWQIDRKLQIDRNGFVDLYFAFSRSFR